MNKQLLSFLIGGIFALIVAMGIGRFAYTPLLPLMQNDLAFSNALAGYLASSNYAGYLFGAILVGIIPFGKNRARSLQISLLISIVTTAFMGFTHSYVLWLLFRFLSGVASAFVFVLASSIVLDQLAAKEKTNWVGMFYSGPGLGIFLTGILVPVFARLFKWEGAWIGLAVISLLLALLAFKWLNDEPIQQRKPGHKPKSLSPLPPPKWLTWLCIAYGCEGLGYIVTGTFIVSIAEKMPSFHGDAAVVWMVVGLAAAPSCMIWSSLAKKWGMVKSLVLAMILQAAGIAIPIVWMNLPGVAFSALLFGATFMGITTLATTLVSQISLSGSSRMIGLFTAVYATGQMIGPTGAGILSSVTHNYNSSLAGAAGVVLLGALLLVPGIRYEQNRGLAQESP